MVRTATRIRKVSSQDSRRLYRVAIGFIHQPHRFHQEASGVACCCCFCRSVRSVKVDLEFAPGPQHDFLDTVSASDFPVLPVAAPPPSTITSPLHSTFL